MTLRTAALATLLLACLALAAAGCEGEAWPTAAEAPITPGELSPRTAPGAPPLPYFVYVPRAGGSGSRLLVSVHGISRNAAEHAHGFVELAERRGVVLAIPLFREPPFADYQRLGRRKRGARADLALERMIDEVGRHTGARTDAFYLFGHSGGAQFAHRFAMAHPERVAAVAASSAGWYTLPDPDFPYPDGLRQTDALPGVRFDPRAFLRVPVLVSVGELDLRRGDSLRHEARLDERQGRNRLERAARWSESMNRAAAALELPPPTTLIVVPGVGHDFGTHLDRGDLAERVFRFLFEEARTQALEPEAPSADQQDVG